MRATPGALLVLRFLSKARVSNDCKATASSRLPQGAQLDEHWGLRWLLFLIR